MYSRDFSIGEVPPKMATILSCGKTLKEGNTISFVESKPQRAHLQYNESVLKSNE